MEKIFKKQNRVAFQGEEGAYSEEAAFLYFGNSIKTIGCKTLSDVFQMLDKNRVDYAVVPVENSLEGTVGGTYDLFLKYDLKPCGEVFHRIRHCLISFSKENLNSIKKVYSHPQALGQCKEFLEKYRYEAIPVYDTAGGVEMIKEKKLRSSAGIASERAAKIYEMKVIKKSIETNHQNYTRFLILSKKETRPTGNDKTSLIFTTKHVPGALFRALKPFATRKINLTKLESRPLIGKPWEYNFILECEGHREEEKTRKALEDLKKSTTFLKIIGSYPKTSLLKPKVITPKKFDIGLNKIAIIGGAGKMGSWFSEFFIKNGVEVIASDIDKRKLKKLKNKLKVKTVKTNQQAVKLAKFILISVLPQDFEKVIKEISPFVKKDQIIIDITSVKEVPVKIMHHYLKSNLILGTHPLFGPKTKDTRLNLVLTPTTKKEKIFAQKFKNWLEQKDLKVITMSPQRHDTVMAWVLGFSHFIGLTSGSTLINSNLKELKKVGGPSFKTLLDLTENVIFSSPEFYSELQFTLPKINNIESVFEKEVRIWREIIKSKNKQKFIKKMLKIQNVLQKSS